jgi:teichuronic acid biosynthesis glycosyltransferase TuaG
MISIIIPTYNDSENLVKTIASCLVQDVESELIVVDDCSTKRIDDTTMNFIQSFCTFIVTEHNLGLAEARDEGIKVAHGEFILPLDTGDWLYPHVLGKMASAMEYADVVFGNMDEKDGGRIHLPPGRNGITKEGMLEMNQLWCTSLFRRSLWETVHGYANGLHTSYEDYFYFNKCLMAGATFKYIPTLIYRHTFNPNSMLSKLHKDTDYYNNLARRPLL